MPKPISPGTSGAINELRIVVDLLSRGFDMFRAVSPSCSCDLIGLRDGRCYRIEVTKGKYRSRTNGPSYLTWVPHDPAKYDILALIMPDDAILYMPEII